MGTRLDARNLEVVDRHGPPDTTGGGEGRTRIA